MKERCGDGPGHEAVTLQAKVGAGLDGRGLLLPEAPVAGTGVTVNAVAGAPGFRGTPVGVRSIRRVIGRTPASPPAMTVASG